MSKKLPNESSSSSLFHRYVWLVDTIYSRQRLAFEQINEKWLNSSLNPDGEDLPLRTFHNHRKAIEELFEINIECDKRSGYKYYIENTEDMERGGVRSWLLNTFAINNLINESHKLKHRILFEKIPSGQHYLLPIIEAMRNGKTVEMTYQSFFRDEPTTFEVEPYCVKVFRQRWYLVARSISYDHPRIYALDRVSWLDTTEKSFALPTDFDAEEYFTHCFGIIHSGEPEVVEIKVFNDEQKVKYFQSLPLHPSQTVVSSTADYTIFGYYLMPTFDFCQELLSHGSQIEVLSPTSLREEIATIAQQQFEIYVGRK